MCRMSAVHCHFRLLLALSLSLFLCRLAAAQGLPSCNGWTFWHFEDDDGRLVPLDARRQAFRHATAVDG